jgi:hypothetical protein
LANSGVAHVSVVQSGASSPLGFCLRCRAVDADQAVNAGMASLTCCQLSTSTHRLALRPAGCCSQLWWIRGLSAWIAPPFILGPTLETIKIRTDNDLLQRAVLGRYSPKPTNFWHTRKSRKSLPWKLEASRTRILSAYDRKLGLYLAYSVFTALPKSGSN